MDVSWLAQPKISILVIASCFVDSSVILFDGKKQMKILKTIWLFWGEICVLEDEKINFGRFLLWVQIKDTYFTYN